MDLYKKSKNLRKNIIINSVILLFAFICNAQSFEDFPDQSYGNYKTSTELKLVILSENLEITGSQTWENETDFLGDIIFVENGATLTIKNTLAIQPEGKIIVKRGGELVLDGAHLISICEMWKGIEVWGTKNLPPTSTGAHGKVTLKNNAVIENAIMGIRTIRAEYDQTEEEVLYSNFAGGKVHAKTNAVFRNCKFGVIFYPYNYDYIGAFSQVTFETTDSLLNNNGYPVTFAYMNRADGIHFSGCTFKNTRGPSEMAPAKRGIGIYSVKSDFEVKGYCTAEINPCPDEHIVPCRFEKLYYGIKALNTTSVPTFSVDTAEFTDNVRAVYASAVDNLTVIRSKFEMGGSFYGTRGLYLDECTGYTVEENRFYETQQESIGLIINQSGTNLNQIYRNEFSGLKYGLLAQNENRAVDGTGLEIRCNEFTGNNFDLAITHDLPEITKETGIAIDQGSPDTLTDAPAGNRFSWTGPLGTATDINNQTQLITYYYHVDQLENLKPKYITGSTVDPKPNPFAPWIPDQSCPSNIDTTGSGTSGVAGLMGLIASSGQKADSVSQLIQSLEDAGDTEGMKWEVEMSPPQQAQQVYNELMGTSPFVSDTVMASAIEKENVLVDAMIRDVMVANPESAKNDALLQKLGERTNPLPDYMLGQILQGRSLVSVYGDLMAKHSFYRQKRAVALNRLVKFYLNDTIDPENSMDSLAVLLENEYTLRAKYSLAFVHVHQGDWDHVFEVLNAIQQQFVLSAGQQLKHEQMVNYVTLLGEMDGQEPDSTQLAELFEIESPGAGRASVYARNMLIDLGLVDYDEPIIYPDMTKSAKAQEYERLINLAEDKKCIEVFPNPAGDYLIVEHYLEFEPVDAFVQICNIKGEIVKQAKVTGKQDQQTLDIKALKPGIYIVTLYENNQETDAVKFTKTK